MADVPAAYMPILAKLDADQQRISTLEEEMNRPETAARPARLVELAKEHGRLGRQLEKYRQFQAAQKTLEETQSLVQGDDAEMRQLAESELPALQAARDRALEEIVNEFLAAEELAVESMILEIRAGT